MFGPVAFENNVPVNRSFLYVNTTAATVTSGQTPENYQLLSKYLPTKVRIVDKKYIHTGLAELNVNTSLVSNL